MYAVRRTDQDRLQHVGDRRSCARCRTLAISPTPLPQIARFPSTTSFRTFKSVPLHIGRTVSLIGKGRGQEKTVRVHPSSRRILELRAFSCLFRKKDGASSKSGSPAQKLVASQQARNPRDRPRDPPSVVFCRPLHYASPDRLPLPQAIGHDVGFFLSSPRRRKLAG